MQKVYYIIRDNGDGSQSVKWYKGSQFTAKQLEESAAADPYDSYQSGDGVQITMLGFPDSVDLDNIVGIHWEDDLPGAYEY
jgi:hypothetical protein